MTLSGAFEIVFTLGLTVVAAYPIGAYLADVFDNRRTLLTQFIGPIEGMLYRLASIEPDMEQKWHEYAIAMVLFGGICMFGSMRCSGCKTRCRSIANGGAWRVLP
jgi:potassium-transporting ATPase potassium-binding subunit